jgi:hypothetical protein
MEKPAKGFDRPERAACDGRQALCVDCGVKPGAQHTGQAKYDTASIRNPYDSRQCTADSLTGSSRPGRRAPEGGNSMVYRSR